MNFLINNKDCLTEQKHPYYPFNENSEFLSNQDKENFANAKILIVGTFPPHRFCLVENQKKDLEKEDTDWFYGCYKNEFWNLLAQAFGESNLKGSLEKQKEFCKTHHLALLDIYHSVYRYKESACDSDIKPLIYTNLFPIIATYMPNLKAILFTSQKAEREATSLYAKYWKECGFGKSYVCRENPLSCIYKDSKKIYWATLPPPSSNNTQDDKESKWRKCFEMTKDLIQ